MNLAQHVPLLEAHDLRTVFHSARGDVHAVEGVELTLQPRETLGIVGESGSGKSVLGRTVMGLVRSGPTVTVSGRVSFAGRGIESLSRTERRHFWGRQVAMVFQDPMTSLNPMKKVGTHVTESLRYHRGLSRADARARALDLLRMVGIPEAVRRLGQYPHELSGGMRQRVVIAMALACEPQLLIADEPTTALDVTVQKQILDLLSSLNEELGMATILISHDLGVVAGRADRVLVMYAGRVVESATADRIFTSARHPYTEGLLGSIPRIENPSHTTLQTISGQSPDMTAPHAGCRFAPRCRYAQPRCLDVSPVLTGVAGHDDHSVACHFPVGTAEGELALATNEQAGQTAAGLHLDRAVVV